MADVLVVLDSIEQAGGDDFEIYGCEAKVASVAFCLRHTHNGNRQTQLLSLFT